MQNMQKYKKNNAKKGEGIEVNKFIMVKNFRTNSVALVRINSGGAFRSAFHSAICLPLQLEF